MGKEKIGSLIKFQLIGIIIIFIGFFIMAIYQPKKEEMVKYISPKDIQIKEDVSSEESSLEEDEEDISLEEDETEISLETQNCIERAQEYLNVMPFSKKGLEKQLVYDGFPEEDAEYASENCLVDWDEQASIAASMYLDSMSFSRQELLKQLEFDGYTREQAEYGVTSVGY